MIRFLSLVLLLTSSVLVGSDLLLSPYVTYQHYSDANKSVGMEGGLYGKYQLKQHDYLEFTIQSTDIAYREYTVETNSTNTTKKPKNLRQLDLALQYTTQVAPNYKLKAGYHYVISSQNFNNKVQGALLGLQYFQKNRFDLGANLTYSLYSDNALADDILQARPYFGVMFGDPRALVGLIRTKISYYYIKPGNENVNLHKAYNSYELQIVQQKNRFTNQLIWSFGDQLYAVKQDVLTMRSLRDLSEGSFLLSSKYTLDSTVSIALSYQTEGIREYTATKSSYFHSISFLASFQF